MFAMVSAVSSYKDLTGSENMRYASRIVLCLLLRLRFIQCEPPRVYRRQFANWLNYLLANYLIIACVEYSDSGSFPTLPRFWT